jgi:hypothetical protein
LIDEARIDVVIGATEEIKERVHYFCFSLLYRRKVGTPSCACGKELFYDNSAGFGGNSGSLS